MKVTRKQSDNNNDDNNNNNNNNNQENTGLQENTRPGNTGLMFSRGIMSSNEIKTDGVNGSRLAEQGPSSGRCSRQGEHCHHVNPVIRKRTKWTSQENKIVMECYLFRESKIRGYRKRMLSLWLQKGTFSVSEQRLVNQTNTIRRNSWMTECRRAV